MTKRLPGVNVDVTLPEEPISKDIREAFWVFTFQDKRGNTLVQHIPKEGMLEAYNKCCMALESLSGTPTPEAVARAKQISQEFADWCFYYGCISERLYVHVDVENAYDNDALVHIYYARK